MDSKIWGPLFWKVFESIGHNAQQPPNAVISFFGLFQYLLPCKYCRASFHNFFQNPKVNRSNASTFIYQIHELVNRKLSKPSLAFDIYQKRLQAFGAPLAAEDINNFLLVLVSNFDHNPMPEQEWAWRKMWAVLPRMLRPILPDIARNMSQCPLPTNQKLSSALLKKTLACSRSSIQRVDVMRV